MAIILPFDYGKPISLNFNSNNVKVEFFSDAKIPNVSLESNNIINLDNDIKIYKGIHLYDDKCSIRELYGLGINTSINNTNFILRIPINYIKTLTIYSSGTVTIENVDTDIDISIYSSKKVNLKNNKFSRGLYINNCTSLNINNCDIYDLRIDNSTAKIRNSNIDKFYSYESEVNMTDINLKNSVSFVYSNVNIENGKALSLYGAKSDCIFSNLQIKNIEILRKGSILLKYCDFLDESKVTLENGNIDMLLEKGIHTKRNFKKNYLEIKKDRQCVATILTENGKVKIKKKG